MEIIAFSNNFKKKKENSHRYALLTLFLLTSSATKMAAIPQSSPRDNLKDIKTTIHATLNFIPHEPRKRLHCKPRKIFVTSEQGRHRIHGIEVTTIALRHRTRRNTRLSGDSRFIYTLPYDPRCFVSDGKKRLMPV